MTEGQDAYGRLVLDQHEGRPAVEMVERDDGFLQATTEARYFHPIRRWSEPERRAIRMARGRVLDVGCGPGRVALHLQARGHEVVGIDVSPLAVRVARARGVRDARVLALEDLDPVLGTFQTVVMFGSNFGLLRSRDAAPRLLRRLHRVTAEDGRILAGSTDVYTTDDPVHLAYHERNRARGRMPGQVRLRIRHLQYSTPWFDYLHVSRAEMAELAPAGGWRLERTIGNGPYYVGVLVKE
ncbi:MAG: class I SAM-dependent methyltransferase [Candidatus Dormibacteraeota bacterium]|nr:class I SAM-dependent methyltransferase [Candidatus Dormibacteraeota bacterium]